MRVPPSGSPTPSPLRPRAASNPRVSALGQEQWINPARLELRSPAALTPRRNRTAIAWTPGRAAASLATQAHRARRHPKPLPHLRTRGRVPPASAPRLVAQAHSLRRAPAAAPAGPPPGTPPQAPDARPVAAVVRASDREPPPRLARLARRSRRHPVRAMLLRRGAMTAPLRQGLFARRLRPPRPVVKTPALP